MGRYPERRRLWPDRCLNCGTLMTNPFCSTCGANYGHKTKAKKKSAPFFRLPTNREANPNHLAKEKR